MDTLINFLTENTLLGTIAIIAIIMVGVSILKSMFKIAMIVAVIGLVLVVFFNFKPQEVIDKGKELADTGASLLEGDMDPNLLSRLSEQDFFIKEEDGETIIEIESLGLRYNLDELLGELNQNRQKEINELMEMTE